MAQTSSRVVEVSSPVARSVWLEVLRADPGATALQTPEYFDAVLLATGGGDVSRLYVLGDGRRLVLPLVRRRWSAGLHRDAGSPAATDTVACWPRAVCRPTTCGSSLRT